jgi:hypothetical protein
MRLAARRVIIWKMIKDETTIIHILEGVKSRRRKATETREKVDAKRPVRVRPKMHCKMLWTDAWET